MSTVQNAEKLPGGLTVVSVGNVGPNSKDDCFDCGTVFNHDSLVVRVADHSEPTPQLYALHAHCVQLRKKNRLHYLSADEHATLFLRLCDAVGALTELSYPGGEFEEPAHRRARRVVQWISRALIEG